MRNIHIVLPYQSKAMEYMSKPLLEELPKLYNMTVSEQVDHNADLNYFIPWHPLVGMEKTNGKYVMMYTHCNAGSQDLLLDACERADLIIPMSFTGRKELIDLGVDPKKIWVIYAPAPSIAFKRRTIGIVGFPQPNGRKREHILLDLAWQYDLSPFQFLFVGAGWDDLVSELQSLGVAAGSISVEDVTQAYYNMDVLLVTGYTEGGPLPILEAMAAGVDILSPQYGYAADLLNDENYYKDTADLMSKLQAVMVKPLQNYILAKAWNKFEYAAEHTLLFSRLLGENVDLYPEHGMSRYAQLLDIIHQTKAKSICEIGAWNGKRAIQMIQAAVHNHPMAEITYQGFDLFETQTRAQLRDELSKAGWSESVVYKRIAATGANVELFKGKTTDTLWSNMRNADLIFVDGGHSEATIENDGWYAITSLAVKQSAVAVFDDYYHKGKPDRMGCNKFIDSLGTAYEISHLPARTPTKDGREIGMVKVTYKHGISLSLSTETYTDIDTLNQRMRFSAPMP